MRRRTGDRCRRIPRRAGRKDGGVALQGHARTEIAHAGAAVVDQRQCRSETTRARRHGQRNAIRRASAFVDAELPDDRARHVGIEAGGIRRRGRRRSRLPTGGITVAGIRAVSPHFGGLIHERPRRRGIVHARTGPELVDDAIVRTKYVHDFAVRDGRRCRNDRQAGVARIAQVAPPRVGLPLLECHGTQMLQVPSIVVVLHEYCTGSMPVLLVILLRFFCTPTGGKKFELASCCAAAAELNWLAGLVRLVTVTLPSVPALLVMFLWMLPTSCFVVQPAGFVGVDGQVSSGMPFG